MDSFDEWNLWLADHCFARKDRNERVFFPSSADLLGYLTEQDAVSLGGFAGLTEAVRGKIAAVGGHGIGHLSIVLRAQWKGRANNPDYVDCGERLGFRGYGFPNFLPVCAYAIGIMSSFVHGEGGYYKDLGSAIGYECLQADVMQINLFWEDLEDWTRDQDGRFGLFRAGTLGGHPHVGKIRAQSALRVSDIPALHRLFHATSLLPGRDLSDHDLTVLIHGMETGFTQGLRDARTEDPDLLRAIIGNEFSTWDGSVTGYDDPWPDDQQRRPSQAHICLRQRQQGVELALFLPSTESLPSGKATLSCQLGGNSHEWTCLVEEGKDGALARPVAGSSGLSVLDFANVDITLNCGDHEFVIPGRRERWLVHVGLGSQRYLREEFSTSAVPKEILLVGPEGRTPPGGTPIPIPGLPRGHSLIHYAQLPQVEGVPAEARGREACQSVRVQIRFEGGIRAALSRSYLPNRLPEILLEGEVQGHVVTIAPWDPRWPAAVVAAEHAQGNPAFPGLLPGTRRFRLAMEDPSGRGGSFTVKVVDADGRHVLQKSLHVKPRDWIDPNPTSAKGLDGAGRFVSSGPRLSGLDLVDLVDLVEPHEFAAPAGTLELDLGTGQRVRQVPTDGAVIDLLDTLAQQGAQYMDYQTARALLREQVPDSMVPFVDILRDLRRRGFLEVHVDDSGRWGQLAKVGVHAFPTSLRLGDHVVWGLAGTPSRVDWQRLMAARNVLFERRELLDLETAPVTWIVGDPPPGIRRAPATALQIAAHCKPIEEIRASLSLSSTNWGTSSGLKVFCPWIGGDDGWVAGRPDEIPSQQWLGDWALIRHPDPFSSKLPDLRRLVRRGNDSRFASGRTYHVPDHRWANWIANYSTADWCAQNELTINLFPSGWPLAYDRFEACIWLPGDLALPYVIERVLVAAAGEGPVAWRLRRLGQSEGRLSAQRNDDVIVTGIPDLYSFQVPRDSSKTWLRYGNIHEDVAQAVAGLLGASLQPMSEEA